MATETEAIYRQRSSPSLTHKNLERCVRAGKLLIAASALNSISERQRERRYPSFGSLLTEILLSIVLLAGCAEMPVSMRAPYSAASPSYSAPWQPPPTVTVNPLQVVAGRRTPVPVIPTLSTVRRISSTSPTARTHRPGGCGKKRGPPPARWRAPRRSTTPRFFLWLSAAPRASPIGARHPLARSRSKGRASPRTAAQLDLARFRSPQLQC